jgi:hypothetical protein
MELLYYFLYAYTQAILIVRYGAAEEDKCMFMICVLAVLAPFVTFFLALGAIHLTTMTLVKRKAK